MEMGAELEQKQPYIAPEVLQGLCQGALRNAGELAREAKLLCENKHYARAYFLAVASIEETGKASIAFDALGRDLSSKPVFDRLLRAFTDHGEKISSAFVPWFVAQPDKIRELAIPLANIMVALKNGREPSMYTEIRSDNHHIQLPTDIVRPKVSEDCVRLAADCLSVARKHIAEKSPTQYTAIQDKLFTLKRAQYQQTMKNQDFWWYFLEELKYGRPDLAAAVMSYRESFELRGAKFKYDEGDT